MTVEEVRQLLEAKGWQMVREGERGCQFRHPSKPSIITLVGPPTLSVPQGVLRSLLCQVHVEEQG